MRLFKIVKNRVSLSVKFLSYHPKILTKEDLIKKYCLKAH